MKDTARRTPRIVAERILPSAVAPLTAAEIVVPSGPGAAALVAESTTHLAVGVGVVESVP